MTRITYTQKQQQYAEVLKAPITLCGTQLCYLSISVSQWDDSVTLMWRTERSMRSPPDTDTRVTLHTHISHAILTVWKSQASLTFKPTSPADWWAKQHNWNSGWFIFLLYFWSVKYSFGEHETSFLNTEKSYRQMYKYIVLNINILFNKPNKLELSCVSVCVCVSVFLLCSKDSTP